MCRAVTASPEDTWLGVTNRIFIARATQSEDSAEKKQLPWQFLN